MSLPQDCPQRNERRGWLGDASLSVDEALFNFGGLSPLYRKFLRDIRTTQSSDPLQLGAVADTAPFSYGSPVADPAWGHAYPTIAYALYQHEGDAALPVLDEHFSAMSKWVTFLDAAANVSGMAQMYSNYGDWYK